MMVSDFPLWPDQASTFAKDVDNLYIFLILLCGTVSIGVFVTIFYFAIKFRRRPDNELAQDYEPPKLLEVMWIAIPSVIFMGLFVWGSWLYFHLARVPDDALDIYATGKQWMWKFQHPTGQREINTLHVPVIVRSRSPWHPRMSFTVCISRISGRRRTCCRAAIERCGSRPRRPAASTSSARSTAARCTPG